MSQTICIAGSGRRWEGVTDEAITPGHLCERGGTNDVQKHSTAGGTASRTFALENDLVGDGIDDAYASGETVQLIDANPGTVIYAWLEYGESVAAGAYLDSTGTGTLRAIAGTAPGAAVARAAETVNASVADTRIKVEAL